MHWGNAWISFEAVPERNALEIVRGSHRGILYDGTFRDPNDPIEPLHGGGVLPRLPDIEAERKVDPNAYDILRWATELNLHGLRAVPSPRIGRESSPGSSRIRSPSIAGGLSTTSRSEEEILPLLRQMGVRP
jgi:hypothetical protein